MPTITSIIQYGHPCPAGAHINAIRQEEDMRDVTFGKEMLTPSLLQMV